MPQKVLLLGAIVLGAMVCTSTSFGRTCFPDTIGIDTTVAKFAEYTNLGEAVGQTFVATDTLVTSITVYRSAAITYDEWGFQLFVLAADTSGTPDASDVILTGPVVYNVSGDGVHPTPFTFQFSPPLALPHRGIYEFAIEPYPCGGAIRYLRTLTDQYPIGKMWFHGREFHCRPQVGPASNPSEDMIFRIVFCGNGLRAVQSSWGNVKAIYR